MTNISDLIARLRELAESAQINPSPKNYDRLWDATTPESVIALLDALEALQAENVKLKSFAKGLQSGADLVRSERDRLQAENARLSAELAAIREQEPAGSIYRNSVTREFELFEYASINHPPGTYVDVYAAPVQPAQEQLPQDVLESLGWLRKLSSDSMYGDRLGALIDWLREHPLQPAQPAYLANGMRFKVTSREEHGVCLLNLPADLLGRWVALVPAENDCHLSGQPAQARELSDAARDVLAERQRQITAEGWTPEHDDEHDRGELAKAAACYAIADGDFTPGLYPPNIWPWHSDWFKPTDTRRNRVKACALLLADIERMDRAAYKGAK